MHVDRVRFDKKVYAKALAQPQCHFVEAMVSDVRVDEDDIVREVHMSSGAKIDNPQYVFDTLGFRSPIVQAAKIETHPLSASSNEWCGLTTKRNLHPVSCPVISGGEVAQIY